MTAVSDEVVAGIEDGATVLYSLTGLRVYTDIVVFPIDDANVTARDTYGISVADLQGRVDVELAG